MVQTKKPQFHHQKVVMVQKKKQVPDDDRGNRTDRQETDRTGQVWTDWFHLDSSTGGVAFITQTHQ